MGNPIFAFALSLVLLSMVKVHAFSFSYSPSVVSSCGNVTITWSGGTAPYYLLVIPLFGTPTNITIPSSAYSEGSGSFSTQLALQGGQEYVLVMSDTTGYGSGGISPVLEIGGSTSSSCNTTLPSSSFTYQLDSDLVQCQPYSFSGYTDASLPVEIYGVIPGGEPFTISPNSESSTTYDWTAELWNATTVMFMMVDAQGRQGGSSSLLTVGNSDDSSCLNSQSPTTTTIQLATSTSAPTTAASQITSSSISSSSQVATTTSSNSASSSFSSNTAIGTIIGTVAGSLLLLVIQ